MLHGPAKHAHEAGAPLTGDCDNWYEVKFKRWQERNAHHGQYTQGPFGLWLLIDGLQAQAFRELLEET